jgi:hypothetical protein
MDNGKCFGIPYSKSEFIHCQFSITIYFIVSRICSIFSSVKFS